DQEEPRDQKHEETFVTAETDKKEAYVGQEIIYTFRLYTAVSIQGAQLDLPEFKDFFTEELVKERKYEVELGGRRYGVNEWRMALFPGKAGLLNTGETVVKGSVQVRIRQNPFDDPFFQTFATSSRPKTLRAPGIEIHVKELPPPPPDFTGLVGQFSMASSLTQDTLNVGETATLRIEISGKGNIREANLPGWKDLDSFKVYPSKPELKLEKSLQGLSGQKTFEYALVAEKPGTTSIPAREFSYFNPESETYEKLSTPALAMRVMGHPSGEKLVTAGLGNPAASSESRRLDIHPIQPPAVILVSQGLRFWEKTAAWGSLLGSPLLLLLFTGWRRYQARSLSHADDRKRSRAFRRARSAFQKSGVGGDFTKISQILKEYFSDRFLVKGTALTPGEIEDLLRSQGIPFETMRRTVYFLEQLDLWRYGGMAGEKPAPQQMKQESLNLLREIEKAT
ncbi:MAG TPA: hypothetical protein DF383_01780, partial [Deltaproteobacteria bacterium]|nr:hypothetical protein [Deltaproteobacteria bacterium]